MNIISNRRRIIIILACLLLFVVGYWVWSDQRKARLTIVTDDNATISANIGSPDGLEEIGTGRATVKTGSDSAIFIEVRRGPETTRGIYFLDSGERREVTISIDKTIARQRTGAGPLANFYLTSEYGYGTDPLSQQLVSLRNGDGGSAQPPDYSDIGQVADVAWVDENNFVYDEFGRGVNYFVDGKVFFLNSGADAEFALNPFLQDFASINPAESILILDSRLLFMTDGVSDTRTTLVRDDLPTNRDTELYSLPNEAVFVTPRFDDDQGATTESETPRSINEELAGEGVADRILVGHDVLLFDYDANQIGEFSVSSDLPVRDVQAYGDGGYALLQPDSVLILETPGSTPSQLPLFYSGVNDIVAYGEDLLLLDEDGLWRYRTDSQTLHLLSRYGEEETYSPSSLAIRDNTAVYSVSVIPEVRTFEPGEEIDYLALDAEATTNRGYIYAVTLSD